MIICPKHPKNNPIMPIMLVWPGIWRKKWFYGMVGGLNDQERQDFFRSMMKKADPATAARLTKALENTSNVAQTRAERMNELGQAISKLSTDQQKNFLQGVRSSLTNKESQAGRAVAQVLSKMGKTDPSLMAQ